MTTPSDDVAVLTWPEQAAESDRLGSLRIPRLLLVPAEVDPPRDTDVLVDWVRVPASAQEIAARVLGLLRRAQGIAPTGGAVPAVDEHGRFVYAGHWTALSPTEARLAGALAERYREVVPEQDLLQRGWDGGPHPPVNALRVHLTRLRQRISGLGLEVVSIRNRGVVLQPRTGTRST